VPVALMDGLGLVRNQYRADVICRSSVREQWDERFEEGVEGLSRSATAVAKLRPG